ncbi:MAG: signal peptidase I [Lachnospiraceae bacterium]|nr:signal peptidase I [Lachnospiraceae bacterium]
MDVRKKRPAPQDEPDFFDIFGEDTPDAPASPEADDGSGQDGQQHKGKKALTPAERRKAHRARQGGAAKSRKRIGEKGPAGKEADGKELTENDPGAAKRRPRRRRSLRDQILRLVIKVAFIAALVFVLTQIVGGVFVAHDNNMYPAVRDGDLCITYRLGGYYNGDIVAFERDGMTTFGRVVAIAGDTIDFPAEGGYTVNGLNPYEVVFYQTLPQDPVITYPYTVGEGEVFLLCDQREEAVDSRSFGPVSELKGKVVLQLRRRGF